MRCYKRARKGKPRLTTLPAYGSPDGFGTYGVLEVDDETVLCHECGARPRGLGGHLRVHEMTADEYREAHGLPRTLPLVCREYSAALSESATRRLGSPGWRRLEAARDPQRAADARDTSAMAPAVEATRTARNLPAREPERKTCPWCGTGYTGRGTTCGATACVRAGKVAGAMTGQRLRGRALTADEAAALRCSGGAQLAGLVRRLQGDGVSSVEIGGALGHGAPWMSKYFPRPTVD